MRNCSFYLKHKYGNLLPRVCTQAKLSLDCDYCKNLSFCTLSETLSPKKFGHEREVSKIMVLVLMYFSHIEKKNLTLGCQHEPDQAILRVRGKTWSPILLEDLMALPEDNIPSTLYQQSEETYTDSQGIPLDEFSPGFLLGALLLEFPT